MILLISAILRALVFILLGDFFFFLLGDFSCIFFYHAFLLSGFVLSSTLYIGLLSSKNAYY